MFHQLVMPVGGNLLLSFLVAAIPIAVVLVLLGVVRRPAWQAALSGLVSALVIAVLIWKMPVLLALNSVAAGATFALWPVMWIAFNALILYNIAVASGRFEAFRAWLLRNLPNDRRIALIVVGFSFGALLEGVAGFGSTIAIASALLIGLGFSALDAVVFALIFDTAPVAFGALGVPITTLGSVTQLPAHTLGAMVGRQLPFLGLMLPFYAVLLMGGLKAIRGVWPALLVAGGSFALAQFVSSNLFDYTLTDVFSSLLSLVATLAFVKLWKPAYDPQYAMTAIAAPAPSAGKPVADWEGWAPWLILAAVVVVWTYFKIADIGAMKIEWPGLHNQVFITLYEKLYAAVYTFQPLATGTAILVASLITALVVGLKPSQFVKAVRDAAVQIRLAAFTVALIVGLAYLMNYGGMTYTLGVGVASVGPLFPLVSAFLGWVAVFLSGSDTSGNALFGNLQVVAARQLNLDPILMAASNSSGGVMGKMISPQNICTGTATNELRGREGEVLARTFKHSVILTLLMGLLVLAQQYLFPGIIPH